MKKHHSFLAIGLCCLVLSCNSKSDTGLSPAAQKNLDAMRGVTKCFESKDFSNLGDFIADDGVDHSGDNGDIKGLAAMKTEFAKYMTGIDSMKAEVIKELADDEYVMSWMRYTGAFKTAGMGHKAGEPFVMKAIELGKFKDGKAVEHWTMMEPGDLMKMMGGMQQPAMPMPGDSSKKAAGKK